MKKQRAPKPITYGEKAMRVSTAASTLKELKE
ncbi:hypothetical protein GGQ86_004057 [Xanthobacter flavus]|uniref:Uncharacterized protein n=1 Tax=Xanthobacter flavus TaxID=281 RepID=A0ABU1KLU8_XANFL|nr:hypothetical protein [Xanthobacter flavus]